MNAENDDDIWAVEIEQKKSSVPPDMEYARFPLRESFSPVIAYALLHAMLPTVPALAVAGISWALVGFGLAVADRCFGWGGSQDHHPNDARDQALFRCSCASPILGFSAWWEFGITTQGTLWALAIAVSAFHGMWIMRSLPLGMRADFAFCVTAPFIIAAFVAALVH
ncbi:MAG: hypothetical protein RLZZ324_514 [Candidatus Parcubacteria bacterium]|jgi:hypothetical protein